MKNQRCFTAKNWHQAVHWSTKPFCLKLSSLTPLLQTRCSSPWPVWPSTPAMSSCRSTSWPSCTTSRWSSDALRPPGPLWLSAPPAWRSSGLRAGDPYGPCGGGSSPKLEVTLAEVDPSDHLFSKDFNVFDQCGRCGGVKVRLICSCVKHTSLLRTCMNCVDIHVWPQSRNILISFHSSTVEMSWLFIIVHRRWFLKENFTLSQQAILSLPKICASNWPWHQNGNKET